MATQQRRVTISDLEKTPTGPVWAMNATSGSNRSLLVLTVPRLNGPGVDSVKIPVTYLPIELTGQVPKRQLLACSDFRRAVSSGYLTLVSEEEAEKAMGVPGAREELLRLQEEDRALQAQSAALTTGAENPEALETQVSPKVQQFIATMDEQATVTAALNTVRSMGTLKEGEYRAIGSAARSKRGFEALAEFCETAITDLA